MTKEEYLQTIQQLREQRMEIQRRHREAMATLESNMHNAINDIADKYSKDKNELKLAYTKAIEEIECKIQKAKSDWCENAPLYGAPTQTPQGDTANPKATISIVDFKGAKWVRVQALGEDFVVAPEDLDDGADHFSFDSAQEKLKELGLATFNRMQGFLIAIYIEEINKALEEAGGKKFAKDIYISSELWRPVGSCADSYGNHSWCFYGNAGCFNYDYRYSGGFRCRPVLAYTPSHV